MKKINLLIIFSFTFNMVAQDGSDIKYVKISNLDTSYIGKIVHLDFYNRSFAGLKYFSENLTDKVTIELDNKKIDFLEYRNDTGHNNWFSEQYLESIEFVDELKIRITMCKIEDITPNYVKVILFLQYKEKNGRLNYKNPNRIKYSFPREILTEVLVLN
ncbi:hypothetical protein DMZ43_09090 [Meridianimaribacter sp. CL38]|uniref:hypothetical protein n=1 Tax=Meridianimaribacter sp. CL38 TaxID=2213021 RepID=UPI00103FA20E|nr:hypothetical protein [Meridianimaribacter sp. CL38]TBV26049.1 hypothetical protein DMZ43_09090 [Meridianimaribacter sp. CL38]